MALVRCHECDREISTGAKVCPHCGARNKSRKKSKALRWIFTLAVIAMVFAGYAIFVASLDPNFCESSIGRKEFVRTFDGSPYAQRNKLRVVDVRSQKEVSRGERAEDSVCEAILRLNDGRELTYTFSFEKSATDGYLIRGKPK
jgi:predicted nucleic acid-binding Zn ribbon protein